jgi:simple sugar transport system ATP-binding protein
VIISHRVNDIFEVGDRVMLLKRGRNVGDRMIAETTIVLPSGVEPVIRVTGETDRALVDSLAVAAS